MNGYLLDTHVFLWLVADDPRLSDAVRAAVLDRDHTLLLSAVSVVELSIKLKTGKLKLDDPLEQCVREASDRFHLVDLPLRKAHAIKLAELPLHHRDPFDRLLVAQTAFEKVTLLSQDPQLLNYGVPIIS